MLWALYIVLLALGAGLAVWLFPLRKSDARRAIDLGRKLDREREIGTKVDPP